MRVANGYCLSESYLFSDELILSEVFCSGYDSLRLEISETDSHLAVKHVEQPKVLFTALENNLTLRIALFLKAMR